MCVGQAFSFEACGHSQSIYSTICAQSSNNKTNTSCDRLEYMGVKPGLCSSCQSQDAHIENLRKELKAKESELNEALMARGDKLLAYSALVEQPQRSSLTHQSQTNIPSIELSAPSTSSSIRISKRKMMVPGGAVAGWKQLGWKENTPPIKKEEAAAVRRVTFSGGVKFQDVAPTKTKNLSADIEEIASSWWKEREGYQATLGAFQVKSLGAVSYKEKIEKCNYARDELIKARFAIAEAEIVKLFD